MVFHSRTTVAVLALLLSTAAACSKSSSASLAGVTPASHTAFPIQSGAHATDCATCHTNPSTFSQFNCLGCHAHDQSPTDLVHASVTTGYAYQSQACYGCHQVPVPQSFDHKGVTANCALCHDVGASFAALPQPGFTHMATGGADCGGCHSTSGWGTGTMHVPSGIVSNPANDVTVTGLVPSYAGTSISKLTPLAQTLPMGMNHATSAIASATLGTCSICHGDATTGVFYPGLFHSSLANAALTQPTVCSDCHAASAPRGFVGPMATQPARTPPSGEMKHDAVAWSGGAPTTTQLVVADCGVCHTSPSDAVQATWATNPTGSGAVSYHGSLGVAQMAQPSSCVDCHANSRPATVLTSSTSALPAGATFDHRAAAATGDCATCHAGNAGTRWTSWSGGRFHLPGSATPSTCLPCHSGERPTSSAAWVSTTYTATPFDYVTNAAGIAHGDGQDCVACHAGPGTGTWGGSQNWVGGRFPHGPGTAAATTCIACHMSQRPDLQPGTTAAAMATLLGFDHSVNGTGDCYGCHQATVTAGRYQNYFNPTTQALPNGDWGAGFYYPGADLVSGGDKFVTVTEIALTRSGSANLVTGSSTTSATLYNAMSHVSSDIPAAMTPGPAGSPNMNSCWHCHVNTNGVVSSYIGAQFHAALTNFSSSPGGTVTPFPQPTAGCNDCHADMRPAGIVEGAGSELQPMDHSALFTTPVTIGGATVSGVADMDCSACHKRPGDTWTDGAFHASIGGAVPQDCTVCHYPLMADAAVADVANGALYSMAHQSAAITVQRCDACHATALSRSTTTPLASALWQTGAYHASVAAQPTACLDCHSNSDPAPNVPTQSTVVYVLAQGGTSTNGGQWMNHGASAVVGLDCARCHASDAKPSGAAWSRSTPFHASASSPGTCQACHGLTNGGGTAAGTNNNLPVGLTDSTTLTTASADATTGVPVGTHDEIVHTDANASGHDCAFCHTQVGPSTATGIQGQEWAQARFHASFSASAPLVLNATTGRCSDCHMNVRPGTSFAAQDHSTFTNASGSQDCSSCHSWPGTGTSSAPNWLGGGNSPQFIAVGGFAIPQPPATSPTTEAGIANLPHPSVTSGCSTCHSGGVGGKGAMGYDHASTLINTACNACHEAGSNLVATLWNGATTQSAGAGDTRPFTLTSIRATRGGDSCTVTAPNHFYPVDCAECHNVPTGNGLTTTGTAYTTAFTFPHTSTKMSNPSTCNLCHVGTTCPK